MFDQDMDTKKELKYLSLEEFVNFGIKNFAYIREIDVDSQTTYAIHAADGTPLSVTEDLGQAILTLRNNDLIPVTIQ